MSLNYGNFLEEPNLTTTLESFEESIKYSELNCVRVGIIDSYDENTRVAKVNIANKLTIGLKDDGSAITQNYAPIYAKVLFFGWGNIGITHPINQGMEGILLFNDRELESWYINGNINNLAHKRAHSKTDAIFIAGLLSLPNMIATLQNCLNLFYGLNNIQISNTGITINGNTIINGNLTVNGAIEATGDIVAGGISLLKHYHKYNNNPTTEAKGNVS
jgi:hypothetical protein